MDKEIKLIIKKNIRRVRGFYSDKQIKAWGLKVEYNEKTGNVKVFNSRGTRLTEQAIVARHPYGKDKSYKTFSLSYLDTGGPNITMLKHVLVWVLHNGSVPHDMNVTFKDNNPNNCRIENLELLTPEQSILKRGLGRNQFTAGLRITEVKERKSISEEQEQLIKANKSISKRLVELSAIYSTIKAEYGIKGFLPDKTLHKRPVELLAKYLPVRQEIAELRERRVSIRKRQKELNARLNFLTERNKVRLSGETK